MKYFIDLFCGAGGLSKGLEKAGLHVVFASDFDKICSNTYKLNHPKLDENQYFLGDIRVLNKTASPSFFQKYQGIDLVAGGPPCQGFSMANRQRIINDPRNVLYKEYLTFLSKIEPKFFVMENVKGMLNKIPEIVEDFHKILGDKYDIG